MKKTMKKTVHVPEAVRDQIQAAQYEVESRKDLLSYMATGGVDIHGESFTAYHKEFQDYFVQLQIAKDCLQKEILEKAVPGRLIHWDLDFNTCDCVCEYEES